MKKTFLLLLFITFFWLYGLTQIPVGTWRDHLSYRKAVNVIDAGNRVYCATQAGLIYFNKDDNSINKFSKVHGLSDINISALGYHAQLNILMVGYDDGNFDILKDNTIMNIPDIKNKFTLINKRINNILISGNKAYMACGFGIVVFNLERVEFTDTYMFGESGSQIVVNDIATDGNLIYAATENGLYTAEIANPNLVNFEFWYLNTTIPNHHRECISVELFSDRILVAQHVQDANDIIYQQIEDSWSIFNAPYGTATAYRKLENSNNQLVITTNNEVHVLNSAFQPIKQLELIDPYHAIIDNTGAIWIADFYSGFLKYTNNYELLIPNGPEDSEVFSLFSNDKNVYAVRGGVTGSYGGLFRPAQLYTFSEQKWKTNREPDQRDFLGVVSHPSNPDHVFVTSWGHGILEYKNGELTNLYDIHNSPLESVIPGTNNIRVLGLAFDRNNNLYVTNSGSEVENTVHILKPDGNWSSLPYGSRMNTSIAGKMIITRDNNKWVSLPRGAGLFAFNENGTLDNHEDDQTRKFNVTDIDGGLISNTVLSLAEDRDGNVWVGTTNGPAVYNNPGNVFTGEGFYARQILIPKEDDPEFADKLLENQAITAITIDGANRKWFGTLGAGAFLMSPDGITEIQHFTTENSPLLSNFIFDITIHHPTGEVFFATDKGLISYRDKATKASDKFGKVYVFPNPVRETYQGDITITGLAQDVNVKITDITGNIVYETTALGGQAIWNGNNFSGKRVKTGVYLVFCTNDDGSETHVTKLLFIN